jgi:hypothetical protein
MQSGHANFFYSEIISSTFSDYKHSLERELDWFRRQEGKAKVRYNRVEKKRSNWSVDFISTFTRIN